MSAQEMVALLRKPISNGTKQHSLSAPSNQLLTYFLNIGSDVKSKLNKYILDKSLDFFDKLVQMASLLACRVVCDEQIINGMYYVVIKVVIERMEYTLIATTGASDHEFYESKRIAAKKAILILKILTTDDHIPEE